MAEVWMFLNRYWIEMFDQNLFVIPIKSIESAAPDSKNTYKIKFRARFLLRKMQIYIY